MNGSRTRDTVLALKNGTKDHSGRMNIEKEREGERKRGNTEKRTSENVYT